MRMRIGLLLALLATAPTAAAADYVAIPGGVFVSALAVDGAAARIAL